MAILDTLAWGNATLSVIYVVLIGMKGFFMYRFLKKETIAIFLDDHGNTIGKKKIKPNKSHINFKEGAYNITSSPVKYGKKRLLFYYINNPDPIQLHTKSHETDFKPETYEAILKNELIKTLNKPQGLFGGLDTKKLLIFVGIGFVAFLLYKGLVA